MHKLLYTSKDFDGRLALGNILIPHYNTPKFKRMTVDEDTNFSFAKNCPGWIRRFCSYKKYKDIDMVNSGPNILWSILQMYFPSDEVPAIQEISENRDEVIEEIKTACQKFANITNKQAKKMINTVVNGGDWKNRLRDFGFVPPPNLSIKIFTQLKKDIHFVANALIRYEREGNPGGEMNIEQKQKKNIDDILDAIDFFKKGIDKKVENYTHLDCAKVIAGIILYFEKKIVNIAIESAQKDGFKVCGINGDGFYVRSDLKSELPNSLLDNINNKVQEKLMLYNIKFIEKSNLPTQEDQQKYYSEFSAAKRRSTPFEYLKQKLNLHANKNNLIRFDGKIYKGNYNGRWEPLYDEKTEDHYSLLINDVLGGEPHYNLIPNMYEHIYKTMKSSQSMMFPIRTKHELEDTIVIYQNGFLDKTNLQFTLFEDCEGDIPFSLNFRNIEFTDEFRSQPTPKFDSIITEQLDAPTAYIFKVLLGRIHQPFNSDNLQIALMMKGYSQTGKSTIQEIIMEMFAKHQIGTISANLEKVFGLEALYDKQLVIIEDMPDNFIELINSATLQSMVSGGDVSIARKNKVAITKRWSAHLLLASNKSFDIQGGGDAIARRIPQFPFETIVEKGNNNLKDEIINEELDAIMIQSIEKCLQYRNDNKTTDFWDTASDTLIKEREQLKEETDYFSQFLQTESKYYTLTKLSEEEADYAEVMKSFKNFMKFQKNSRARVDKVQIKNALKKNGYEYKRYHQCLTCHNKQSPENCKDHYQKHKNTKQVEKIYGLVYERLEVHK